MLQKPKKYVKDRALGNLDFRASEEEASLPDGSLTAGATVEGIDVGFIFSTAAAVGSGVGADVGLTSPKQKQEASLAIKSALPLHKPPVLP
jgi:hypothetical protein